MDDYTKRASKLIQYYNEEIKMQLSRLKMQKEEIKDEDENVIEALEYKDAYNTFLKEKQKKDDETLALVEELATKYSMLKLFVDALAAKNPNSKVVNDKYKDTTLMLAYVEEYVQKCTDMYHVSRAGDYILKYEQKKLEKEPEKILLLMKELAEAYLQYQGKFM